MIKSAFSQSAHFFARPQTQKDALAWTTPEANRGYSCIGKEKVTNLADKDQIEELRNQNPDLKESYEIGREGQEGFDNPWPDRFDAETDQTGERFRDDMQQFFLLCKELHKQVMRAIALALEIDETWFDEYTVVGDNTLRLLHYPPVRKSVLARKTGQVRAGAHTDYGSITLLFQDDRGGLQVQSPKGSFIDARPIPDTIVVNAADLLTRWSNDTIKSTVHRVVEPPPPPEATQNGINSNVNSNGTTETQNGTEEQYPARYSIAYFCNPDFDKFIDVIPHTVSAGNEKKYPGINSGEYLVQRLAATY